MAKLQGWAIGNPQLSLVVLACFFFAVLHANPVLPRDVGKSTPSPITIQDLLLGCESNNGMMKGTWSFDETLANSCKGDGYSCTWTGYDGLVSVYHLNRPTPCIPGCDATCLCGGQRPQGVVARNDKKKSTMSVKVTTKVTATAIGIPSNTLNFASATGLAAA